MKATVLTRLKPGASRRKHLLLAALLWSLVGGSLLLRGLVALPVQAHPILFVSALLIGSLKSHLILDRSAERVIDRIRGFGDRTCLGAVYSWRTWGLVLLMMTLGIGLRRSQLMPVAVDLVSITIGWALFYSSRRTWRAWREKG